MTGRATGRFPGFDALRQRSHVLLGAELFLLASEELLCVHELVAHIFNVIAESRGLGAMLAQLCPPSMTFPIQHALLYPERAAGVEAPLDLTRLLTLEFKPIDENCYPMIRLAREAMVAGGVAPAAFNAANEVAVEAFLRGQIPFLAIPRIVGQALDRIANFEPAELGAVLAVDRETRRASCADIESYK